MLIAISLGVTGSLLGGVPTFQAELTLRPENVHFDLPSPMPQRVILRADPPKSIVKPPASTALRWAAIPFGSKARPVEFALCVEEGAADRGRLFVDSNGNGDLTDDAPAEWKPVGGDQPGSARFEGAFRLPLQSDASAAARIVAYRYRPDAARLRGLAPDLLFYYRDYCLAGNAEIEGRRHAFLVSDEDTAGDFAWPGGRSQRIRFGLDLDGDGRILAPREWFDAGAAALVGRWNVTLKSIPPGGHSAEFLKLPPNVRLAKSFTASDATGKVVRFPADYAGKLVLLDFWATWCGPCRAEAPNLVAAARRFKGPGFDVLGVSLDRGMAAARLLEFTAREGMIWRQVYEDAGWNSAVARQYGVHSIPHMFLIDADSMTIVASGPALRGPGLTQTIAAHLARPRSMK